MSIKLLSKNAHNSLILMSKKRGHVHFFCFKMFDPNTHRAPTVGLTRPALNHFTKKCQHHLTLLPHYKRNQSNILETKPLRQLKLLLKSIRSSWYLPTSSAAFLNIWAKSKESYSCHFVLKTNFLINFHRTGSEK